MLEATLLANDISDSPSEDLPSFLALLMMGFEEILVWLEVRQNANLAGEAVPAQMQDHKRKELHGVESWADGLGVVLHKHRSDRLLAPEGALFKFHDASSVCGSSFSKDQEWAVFARLFDKGLSFFDGVKSVHSAFIAAASWDVDRVKSLDQGVE